MLRAIDKWLWGYIRSVRQRPRVDGLKHLFFCVADHFEPSRAKDTQVLDRWVAEYPKAAEGFRDADGRTPQHTFFYPIEAYREDEVASLADLCRQGHGEVEMQLHHRSDTPEGFREKLVRGRDLMSKEHGLLGSDKENRIRYGFVHGNWALCNSRPDGDWCGVNEELGILAETGCYSDFTFPSAPSPTQPRMVNAVYRAADREGKPRGHDGGVIVRRDKDYRLQSTDHLSAQEGEQADEGGTGKEHPTSNKRLDGRSLMLITGPLGLNWRRRKWGMLPRLENGALDASNPPTAGRVDLWVKQHIHLVGRPDWIFVKVHAHGCDGNNVDMMLGKSLREMYEHLGKRYNDGKSWALHFVTAREMYNLVRAAEDGKEGEPGKYRDYEIGAPGAYWPPEKVRHL